MTTVARLLPRALSFVPRVASAGPVHWRRRLIAALLATAVLVAAYVFWFRDSSLVKVERVRGAALAPAPAPPRLRAPLTGAAKGMTTLHVDQASLERVVASSPAVHA